jgi:type I restriction enzyme, S subunit
VNTGESGLPIGWSYRPVAELVAETVQLDPRRTPAGNFKYVDVSSVSGNALRIVDYKNVRGSEAPSRARKQILKGDVLFATIRPSLHRIAQVPAELDGELCSTAFTVLRGDPLRVDSSFLFFAVSNPEFVARVTVHQRGSGYPAVRDGDVLRESIVAPPLAEQRAIARVLCIVQRARAATDQVVAAAGELRKALVSHLFRYGSVDISSGASVDTRDSEVGVVPAHWEILTVADVALDGSRGVLGGPFGSDLGTRDYVDQGVPVIRGSNLVRNRFSTAGLVFISEGKADELRRTLVGRGDVVVTQRGTLGQAAVIPDSLQYERLVLSQSQMGVKVNRDRMLPEFLHNALLTLSSQERIRHAAIRSGVPHINLGSLREFRVPVPPLEDQSRIVGTLSAVDSKITFEEQRREALDQVFNSVLHQLMTGRQLTGPLGEHGS